SNSVSEYIEVEVNSFYTIKTGETLRVAFYDSFKSQIKHHLFLSGAGAGIIINSPFNAKYMRVTVHNDFLGIAQINKGQELLSYEKYYKRLKEDISVNANVGGEGEQKIFILDLPVDGTFNTDAIFDDYTTTWKDVQSSEVYSFFDNLQTTYPNYITKQQLSPEPNGLPIAAYHLKPNKPVGDNRRLPKVFITCGTHGYEKASTLNMYLLIKQMCENWKTNSLLE